jgi:hypothetical protein
METLKCRLVVTRKLRECNFCFRKFQIGTKMNYWVGIFDGEFCSSYACETCQEIMSLDSESAFPEGYVNDMLDKDETPEKLLSAIKGRVGVVVKNPINGQT